MRAERGFTLIELLVVIAVIAVLTGILLPSLSMARMHAKRVVSRSNLRQIGLAMELYTQDNEGFFPETSHGLTGTDAIRQRSWVFTLKPYVGDVNEIRICPADPQRQERLAQNTSSYIMNEYIAVDAVDPFGRAVGKSYRNAHKLKRPQETITAFVGADDLSPAMTSDHTHSRLWFLPAPNVPWDTLRMDIQPDRYRGRRSNDNTKGSSLYLHADSHVENLKAQAVKDWADEGLDFAKPPER
jgi:prepilin-type N-terminal cleavage/methylation domain-containing protein